MLNFDGTADKLIKWPLVQWDHSPQRSGPAAVYNDDYGVLMVYGGRGPAREEPALTRRQQ